MFAKTIEKCTETSLFNGVLIIFKRHKNACTTM